MNSRSFLRMLWIATATLTVSGCAATHAAIQIGKARQSVAHAKERGAEELEQLVVDGCVTKRADTAAAAASVLLGGGLGGTQPPPAEPPKLIL